MNAVLGYIILGNYITVEMEKRPLLHILAAVGVMAEVIGGLRLVVPVVHLGYLVGMVIRAVVYFVILIRIDRDIRDELREIVGQTGIYWPDFL